MENMWFVLLTLILQKPYTDGTPGQIGDVLKSTLMGASYTQEDCEAATDVLVQKLTEIGGGSVLVVGTCVELPAEVGAAQGFTETQPAP